MYSIVWSNYKDRIVSIVADAESISSVAAVFEKSKTQFKVFSCNSGIQLSQQDFGFGGYDFWQSYSD